jgi:thioesterase domain-containing protein
MYKGTAMNISEVLKAIIPYETLGMSIEEESSDSLTLGIMLNKNLNDKNTMFAGSIYSVMVLCGWALAYTMLNHDIKSYDIVIRHSQIDYKSPVITDAHAVAVLVEDIRTKTNGNKSIRVAVHLNDAEHNVCAEFTGEYIGMNVRKTN